MQSELPLSEVDLFLPEGLGHWVTDNYDVFADREGGAWPTVTLCAKNWDFSQTLEKIKDSGCLKAWNTAFKVIAREDIDFYFLTNGCPINGDGIKFIANVSTNKEFLKNVVDPLVDAGFIPVEVNSWFSQDDSNKV
ncbi:MAG: hypothetical protein UW68_C0005G0013 [Candidatus Collierbacteria bacterium GW2011_GWB1_44_6]|uniref:Uncharacterized protein n=2 Tax=Candidatus Collieribacteriota TaxID=1752725 RepID=A0A0G1JQH0_9BACT|nr:MAG: hypothetical protein UV68_C0001G0038 [Candidatus Collierbacteria bacterium GW2011_GWC2_43_12]KKT73620.1 MAG: hypothetical protein UW68_C0005G0013 [Candidatus Collierbacteria bacterium GW2011_GWB1_44_6]KKT84159.1 MAG: hypothetical protein UW80_C0001G0039 [Microgenomates group bacterium GW2011_GWC1_44_9]